MGAALYIVLNTDAPGFDTYVDGHDLSRADEELGKLAEKLGVASLMSFFSMNPADALAEAEQFNTGLTAETVPEEEWFAPAEGLATVRALIAYLDDHPGAIPESRGVTLELVGFQHLLEEAENRGLRWHLAVDIESSEVLQRQPNKRMQLTKRGVPFVGAPSRAGVIESCFAADPWSSTDREERDEE